jgi:hypothetical protein
MEHPVAVGADDGEVLLRGEPHLGTFRQCMERYLVVRFNEPGAGGPVELGEVEPAYLADMAVDPLRLVCKFTVALSFYRTARPSALKRKT